MQLPVRVEPRSGVAGDVEYRWDPDTEILSARLLVPGGDDAGAATGGRVAATVAEPPPADGPGGAPTSVGAESMLSGAVELEGRDGSWIVLDLESGHLAGVEVAVWPNVRRFATLAPPSQVEEARVRVAGQRRLLPRGTTAALEITTHMTAESDADERTIHFRLGRPRLARSVRLGRDLLVDVDADGHLAGLWLLNVPPVPTVT